MATTEAFFENCFEDLYWSGDDSIPHSRCDINQQEHASESLADIHHKMVKCLELAAATDNFSQIRMLLWEATELLLVGFHRHG